MITAGCMTNCLPGIMKITDDGLKAYTVILSNVYVNRLVQYVQSQSNNRHITALSKPISHHFIPGLVHG